MARMPDHWTNAGKASDLAGRRSYCNRGGNAFGSQINRSCCTVGFRHLKDSIFLLMQLQGYELPTWRHMLPPCQPAITFQLHHPHPLSTAITGQQPVTHL